MGANSAWAFNIVDDEDVDRCFDSTELKPKLLLDGGKQTGRRVGIGRSIVVA